MNRQQRRARLAELMERVAERLDVGELEYGNTAEQRPMLNLVREVREEVEDVVGWAFWLDVKLERMQRRLEAIAADDPG